VEKLAIVVAGILGVLLGIWYFVTRSTPDSQRCKKAQGLTRQVLLTAVLVSALSSYLVGCAKQAATSSRSQPAVPTNGTVAAAIDALARTREWQELKVIWNLLTEDRRVFEDKKDRDLELSSLNKSLCGLAIRVRLDAMREKGLFSDVEMAALANLFDTMSSHYFLKRSGMTCYLQSARGGQIADGRDAIEQQAKLLRKHYREGTLSRDVVVKAEETIAAKLRILDILNEEDAGLVTEEEILAKAREWRDKGKTETIQLDYWQRTGIINELLEQKDAALPEHTKRERKTAWHRHRARLTGAAIDLATYVPDDRSEATVDKALRGKRLPPDAVANYLRNEDNPGRAALVEPYAEMAGRKAVPLLRELMRDHEIHVSGHNTDAGTVCTITFPVRTAAARELARMGIRPPGYENVLSSEFGDKSVYKSNTPEGKAVIKELLTTSKNLRVLDHAIWPAGESRDPSMIPLLRQLAEKHEQLHADVVRALGDIAHPDGLPLLPEIVGKGTVDSWTVFGAVVAIGGDRAEALLEEQMLESQSSRVQSSAVHSLARALKEDAVPILLNALKQKDKPYLRVCAGRALQDFGNHAAVPIAMELVASEDEAVRDEAFRILGCAHDEASAKLLLRLADDEAHATNAVENLISRGGELAADTFAKVMASDHEDLRVTVMFAAIGDTFPGVEDIQLKALHDPCDAVRFHAAQGLGRQGVIRALPALRKALSSETHAGVRDRLRDALRNVVENHCENRCRAIMARPEHSRAADLSEEDIFALLVTKLHDDYGDDSTQRQEFAEKVLEEAGAAVVPAVIRYFAEYEHRTNDWECMTYDCQEAARTLQKYPKEAVLKLVTFIGNTNAMNRELGLAVLSGHGSFSYDYWDKPYPLETIDGPGELLDGCLGDPSPRVRAEARRLKTIMAAAPGDRKFAAALCDLKVARDREKALWFLGWQHEIRFSPKQKKTLVPALLEVFDELLEHDEWGRLWGTVKVAGRLKDRRLVAPLKTLVTNYDPNDTSDRESEPVQGAIGVLKSMGVRAVRENNGRYTVKE